MKKFRTSMLFALALSLSLASALSACSSSEASTPTGAARGMLKSQAPAYYRLQLGDFEVTALSDGTVTLPLDQMMSNVAPDEVRQLLAQGFETLPAETSINAFLVNTGSKLLLIDAGAGSLFGTNGGRLISNLKAAGYEPSEIDAVLLTHLHGDHSGGLVVDGKRIFPNATVYLDKADRDYRFSPDAEAAAPANQKPMFPESRAALSPYEAAGKVSLFQGVAQLFPGVTTIAAHGHTPGHTLYKVESKGESLVFSGDLVHSAAVQFPKPQATINFDADESAAASDRQALFAKFAQERTQLAAAHISFPGIGHIRAVGSGYQWVPVPYSRRGMTN